MYTCHAHHAYKLLTEICEIPGLLDFSLFSLIFSMLFSTGFLVLFPVLFIGNLECCKRLTFDKTPRQTKHLERATL